PTRAWAGTAPPRAGVPCRSWGVLSFPTEAGKALGVKRREFISLLGGAAAWPLAARAQQPERVRRIGALMSSAADDPEAPARVTPIAQGLEGLGWTVGRNLRIHYRRGGGDPHLC